MVGTSSKLATLTERDRAILEHVLRYRMSTRPVLKELFFREQGLDALKSTLRRIAAPVREQLMGRARRNFLRRYYLQAFPMCTPDARVYYRLTRRGAREVDSLEALSKTDQLVTPLQAQQLIANFAILNFCAQQQVDVLSRYELREDFPQFQRAGLPARPYFIDERSTQPRLSFILIDHGAEVRWTVRKVMNAIERRLAIPAFERMMRQGTFYLTVLTAFESKKDDITRALSEEDPACAVEIHVVPGLAYVVEARDETNS